MRGRQRLTGVGWIHLICCMLLVTKSALPFISKGLPSETPCALIRSLWISALPARIYFALALNEPSAGFESSMAFMRSCSGKIEPILKLAARICRLNSVVDNCFPEAPSWRCIS